MRALALLVTVAVALPAGATPPRLLGRLRAASLGLAPLGTPTRVSVRVSGGAAALRAAGFSATDGAGEVAWLTVDDDALRRLVALPAVRAIEPARRLHTDLDRSVPLTGAPVARATLGLDGRATVVGIVDTGCDFRHDDLQDDGGRTKLLGLLDVSQKRDLRHADLPDYGGLVWLGDEIQAQLDADRANMTAAVPVSEADLDGHGTHVSGIAASTGRAAGMGFPSGRYVGMAPAARMVCAMAAKDHHGFFEDDVIHSMQFVYDRAAALKLPAVVNLSLGGEGGPHDGSTNFERAITAVVPDDGPGRAVAIAVGNAGSRDQHASGQLLDGSVELAIPFPTNAAADTPLALDLWFPDAPPDVALVSPDGHVFGPVSAGHAHDSGNTTLGRVVIDVASTGIDAPSGRWEATADVLPQSGKAPAGGTWKLVLSGRARRWDAWMVAVPGGQSQPRFVDHLDEDLRAEPPAMAAGAIAVGSFVSRNGWTRKDGQQVVRTTVVGRPSSFSSTGPTIDGRYLPDLSAPGDFIISALASTAPPSSLESVFHVEGDVNYLWADDGVHGVLRGTSQATPHVTGAIALLFQLDPTLTPRRLRELLRTSAQPDEDAGGYSPRSGFGHLDVLRAARLLERVLPTGAVDPQRSSIGLARDVVLPGDAPVRVSVVPRDASGAPLGPGHAVALLTAPAGLAAPPVDAGEGRYEALVRPSAPRGTEVRLLATVDGVPLAAQPSLWIVDDRGEVGRAFRATSGCASGGAGAGALGFALLAIALAWATRRAARASHRG